MGNKRIGELDEVGTVTNGAYFIIEGEDGRAYKVSAGTLGLGGKTTTGGSAAGSIALANGTSYIALADGSSFIATAGP